MLKILFTLFLISIIHSDCSAQQWQTYKNNHYTAFIQDSPYSYAKFDSALADSRHDTRIPGVLNPEHAFWLAFFPGLIVRGAGHFYARKYLTTTALVATTVAGLYLYLTAEDQSGAEGYRNGRPIRHENRYYDLQNYSGLVLFWGTWAYDMIAAPIVCIRHNKRLKESLSMKPYFARNQWGSRIGIQLCCKF